MDESRTRPPYRGVEWDEEREAHPLAKILIALGHVRVQRSIRLAAPEKLLTLQMLRDIHFGIFGLVFPEFAGKLRGPGPPYIPRNVSIGNLARGYHADRVPGACDEFFEALRRLIRELDDSRQRLPAEQVRENALQVAAWCHCRVIEIHPFVNGNGRAARECINYFALRYGGTYVTFERPRDEYLSANRTWIQRRRIDHMVDYLRPQWVAAPQTR